MKAYKVFHYDRTCRNKQYEVGKTFYIKGNPIMCQHGLHCCLKLSDCFNYYYFYNNIHIAEVEVIGEYVEKYNEYGFNDSKICCKKIKILREITYLEAFNILSDETGLSINDTINEFFIDYNEQDDLELSF